VDVYAHWVPRDRIITTNLWSSELSKLVANAFLAQRISSSTRSRRCARRRAPDVDEVANAIGKDSRIGSRNFEGVRRLRWFLFPEGHPELGLSLRTFRSARGFGLLGVRREDERLAEARFANKIVRSLFNSVADQEKSRCSASLSERHPTTPRESAAIFVVRDSPRRAGARGRLRSEKYQRTKSAPMCSGKENRSRLTIAKSAYEAPKGRTPLRFVTEWDEFQKLDYAKIFAGMQKPAFIFDGRNITDQAK